MDLRALFSRGALFLAFVTGCASHTQKTSAMRTALDAGNVRAAIDVLNREMQVPNDEALPGDLVSDNAILLLDRASLQQSLLNLKLSQRDFEAADKAIDLLDLSHGAKDTLGEYIFSGASARYQAPPHEKLLLNVLNMLNYLELHDLEGARVEARRMEVMRRSLGDTGGDKDNAVLGLGGFLAGFTFEKSGRPDEALRYYDDGLAAAPTNVLKESARPLLVPGRNAVSPRLQELERLPLPPGGDDTAEIIFVVGTGRVPHKIAERIPIGLALTRASFFLAPADRELAGRLAVQGLVTWLNFPTLGPGRGEYDVPGVYLDHTAVPLAPLTDVAAEVRKEWENIEGRILASAITRAAARIAAGQVVEKGTTALAGKKYEGVGLLLSLALQAGTTAADTPDTRSWETLPAALTVARVRVPPGRHGIRMTTRGFSRAQTLELSSGGWAVVSLMGLR